MSGFRWTDRHGTAHQLDHFQLIIDESDAVEAEVDSLLSDLESPDLAVRNPARTAIEQRHHRLHQLGADLARWNAHAHAKTQRAAADMLDRIDALGTALREMRLLVGLHDEHASLLHETSDAAGLRAEALAGPATARQMLAISIIETETKLDAPTRAEAWDWLIIQPRFHRSLTSDGGWFAWIDPQGHAHRLVDPLKIERAAITLLVQLKSLRGELDVSATPVRLFLAVERAVALMEKVTILKQDLERLDREADARDLAACRSFAADWRSRKTI